MKARDIALIGLLSATVTAGKLALSFIPNVEIVTLLFIVYTVTFGAKRTIITSIIFTTTDILIYGLSTWILVYYTIWPMLIIITTMMNMKLKTEYSYATLAGLFGVSFGFIFALWESIFYGPAYGLTYWVSGIPFDLIHGVSNFIVVVLLYKPMCAATARGKNYLSM